jgi:hypothetical protein
VREGRVDLMAHFGYADREQLKAMFTHVYATLEQTPSQQAESIDSLAERFAAAMPQGSKW